MPVYEHTTNLYGVHSMEKLDYSTGLSQSKSADMRQLEGHSASRFYYNSSID